MGYGIFLEKECRDEVPCSSHHMKCACYQHDLSLLEPTFITWLTGISTVKLVFFSLFHIVYF